MLCRACGEKNIVNFLDLGFAPPSNAYIESEDIKNPEIYYPLKVNICPKCFLAQTEDFTNPQDLFTPNYAYFSSTSQTQLKHAENYVNKIIDFLDLSERSFVVEVASNDGYLLKNFVNKKIPCLGIEPAIDTALYAEELKIPVIKKFFNKSLALDLVKKYGKSDLIIGNNVYAHVPDIIDFTNGLKHLLSDEGTITLEFPSLYNLIKFNQFDTIYHEHFSYLSLTSVTNIFEKCNLKIYKVEKIPTHGGSLRVYGSHKNNSKEISSSLREILNEEEIFGLNHIKTYRDFQAKVEEIKDNFLNFLITAKKNNKKVGGFGAAAKANTILNYAGIKSDLLTIICDSSPSKQKKFLPGSHIEIFHPKILEDIYLDYLIIFPWNIAEEIKKQNTFLIGKGTKFITLIPEFKIH